MRRDPSDVNSPQLQVDSPAVPPSSGTNRDLELSLRLARFCLELVVVVGCFWVILAPGDHADDVAAFGLIGVIVASIVANLGRLG